MTKEEFIEFYCSANRITWAELSKRRVVLPCACGEGLCKGWAMVVNRSDMIAAHNQSYAPEIESPIP